jgi:hypothetical protein
MLARFDRPLRASVDGEIAIPGVARLTLQPEPFQHQRAIEERFRQSGIQPQALVRGGERLGIERRAVET